MNAVLDDEFIQETSALVEHIVKTSELENRSNGTLPDSKKRKLSSDFQIPSCFGSTTSKNRAKKGADPSFKRDDSVLRNRAASEESNPEKSGVGYLVTRVDIESIIADPSAVSTIRASIRERLRYEAALAAKAEEKKIEHDRLIQEKNGYRINLMSDAQKIAKSDIVTEYGMNLMLVMGPLMQDSY